MASPSATTTVSANVRAMMRLTGTTGERVGDIIGGRDKSTVSRKMKNGQWTVGEIEALASYWDVPISRFFEDPDTTFGLRIPKSAWVTGVDLAIDLTDEAISEGRILALW
jgi:hypothetical protein